jgi:Flp pilus assembly protein TadG
MMPLVGLLLIILTGCVALSVDAGTGYDQQRNDQNVADAAALAASTAISAKATLLVAYDQAADVATLDCTGPSAPCTVVLTISTASQSYTLTQSGCPTTSAQCPAVAAVTQVEAQISERATSPFSESSSRTHTVAAAAIAAIGSTSSTPVCGLCVLNATASQSVSIAGSSKITVQSAPIDIDSSSSSALYETGSTSISGSAINIVGGESLATGDTATPTPVTGAKTVANPLAALAAPAVTGSAKNFQTTCPNYNSTGGCTISAGIYTNFTPGASLALTMNAGTYVIEGTFNLNGAATLTATAGVTIYLTCSGYSSTTTEPCTGSDGGDFNVAASGAYSQTSPSSGAYQGVAIMIDPKDTAQINISGAGAVSLSGSVNAPDSPLIVSASGTSSQINSVMVVSTVTISGNSSLTLVSTQAANAPSAYSTNGAAGLIG